MTEVKLLLEAKGTEVRNPGFNFIQYALHIIFNILPIVADFITTNLITILCPSVLFGLYL